MIDGIPNRPLYFYQKDIVDWACIQQNMGMDQYLLIPFLGGWTSI